MGCENFRRKVISFTLTLLVGLLATVFFNGENFINKSRKTAVSKQKISLEKKIFCLRNNNAPDKEIESEMFYVFPDNFYNDSDNELSAKSEIKNADIKIFSKPQPKYTDKAKQNEVIGQVALRVVFSASGQIGKISKVSGLPDGLTEHAIAAAMQMKFKPAVRNGKPITVTKTITYTFTIY